MRTTQVPAGTIAAADLELFRLTNDPAEAVAVIRAFSDAPGGEADRRSAAEEAELGR